MKKYRWFLLQVLILVVLILPATAMAGELSVSYEDAEYGIGDIVEVAVTVSGENLSIAEGEFVYDYNVLSYVESYGGASDGKFNMLSSGESGSSSLTCVIEFEAIAVGESAVDVTFGNILNYEGTRISNLDQSILIEVLSDELSVDSDKEEEASDYQKGFDGVEASVVYNSDAKLFISKSVENLTLPSGFVDIEAEYNGEKIGAAISARDDKTVLFYLYDNSGNGGYYIFDEESNALSPYVKIAAEEDDYIILWNNGALEVPLSYNETSIEVNGKIVPAFVSDETDKPSCVVYAISESGQKGYYQYMEEDKTISQFLGDMKQEVIPVVSEVEETEDSTVNEKIFLAICIICIVLIIAFIILVIKYVRAVKDKQELLAVSRKKIQEYKKMLER